MDASVALMNQYTAIAARFPPATQPQVPTESSETESAQNPLSPHSTDESDTTPTPPKVETKNVDATTSGVENIVDNANASSSNVIDENKVSIEDLGRDDDDHASELRRRRLQKFMSTEQNKE